MHVAIIMDGNGRWARMRGLPRSAGHAAGAKTVRHIVEAAAQMPIDVLTLYAFSSDNWARPASEVKGLFGLMKRYLRSESSRCVDNGVAVQFIGRRDRFSDELRSLIEHVEQLTQSGGSLLLRIAADYSARDQILAAARRADRDELCIDGFSTSLSRDTHGAAVPDVDLLIRTGGERRLSDFLLWESAYAELVFSDTFWPDFDAASLGDALMEFNRRERRFGGLPGTVQSGLFGESA